jgi:anti-sigma regulatory factor (Ser/Thr protein kinase)
VQFYDHDTDLILRVGQYLVEGLRAGEIVVVIATPDHRRAFEAELTAADLDLAQARRDGTFITLDAADTMSRFIADGRPDPGGFDAVVGGLIRGATETGRPVRAYGEMVALLWDAGNVLEAIELEELWNDLGREQAFTLFCAYPSHSVSGSEHSESLLEVCRVHSSVVHQRSADDRPDSRHQSRYFGAGLHAPSEARNFVVAALRRWGCDEGLVDAAALVVTELATNAVVHARLPFTTAVSLGDAGVLRVSVLDASRIPPVQRHDGPMSQSGRGLALVAALAQRWGVDATDDGKVVWAEFRR